MNLIQGLTPEEWKLVKEGKIVAAIKEVKLRTAANLKDSKALVDRAREIHPKGPPILHRPLTEILEGMLSSLDNLEYHLKTNDFGQSERMRVGLQENVREALNTVRGFI